MLRFCSYALKCASHSNVFVDLLLIKVYVVFKIHLDEWVLWKKVSKGCQSKMISILFWLLFLYSPTLACDSKAWLQNWIHQSSQPGLIDESNFVSWKSNNQLSIYLQTYWWLYCCSQSCLWRSHQFQKENFIIYLYYLVVLKHISVKFCIKLIVLINSHV